MTRYESGQFGTFLKRAALVGAAFFFCTSSAWAQDITLRSAGGGLELSGRYIGYDGENIQIDSEYGALTLRYETVSCEGARCPKREGYFPELRLSGSARMGDVLMPALVDGFARSKGWQVQSEQIDQTLFAQTLLSDESPKARFVFMRRTQTKGLPILSRMKQIS